MKRSLLWIFLILAMLVFLMVACGQTDPVSEPLPTEESFAAETTFASETAPPLVADAPQDRLPEGPIDVYYCSFTQWPCFAMIGTCSEGATVVAKIGEETYSCESYMGWFSLQLPSENDCATMTLTQTLDGLNYDAEQEYTAWPQHPAEGSWPVVTGKNFQFFLESSLRDYRHENIDAQEVYDAFRQRLEERLDTLHAYNPDAEIIYLIAPSSMSTYPELVPEEYIQGTGKSRVDLVLETIEKAGATALDLREIFHSHKYDEMPLYYKLDSHWSDYGAYIAYTALFDHIAQKYPQAAPRGIEEFTWNPGYYHSGDITYYLGMPQSEILEYAYYRTINFDASDSITSVPRYRNDSMLCYSDDVTWENTIRTDRPELPSCLVIRDSFSTQMYDLIPERMNTTHYQGMWNYAWNAGIIADEQPDYIIYLVAEASIESILN